MCVQRFDDSLNSAIHTTYRISLRPSSMREPRDPLLKVIRISCREHKAPLTHQKKKSKKWKSTCAREKSSAGSRVVRPPAGTSGGKTATCGFVLFLSFPRGVFFQNRRCELVPLSSTKEKGRKARLTYFFNPTHPPHNMFFL